ncbi:MAG: hypothetical protein H6674_07470 [Dehalococcoidia bacterium]|nr:hypothetical protein [Dehalococcoidia bacterium]
MRSRWRIAILGLVGVPVVLTAVAAIAIARGKGPELASMFPGVDLDERLGRVARAPTREFPVVESSGPIVLEGDDVLVIDGEHHVHQGDIVLRDRARLEIHNAVFDHVQGHAFEFTLQATDEASVVVTNSEIRSADWLNWNFLGHSTLTLNRVEDRESRIWHWCTDDCTVTVRSARFHGTIDGSANADIEDSPDLFIEYVWPSGVRVDEVLPADLDDYEFPNAGETGVPIHLRAVRSHASQWGLTMRGASDVTIRDASGLTVTLSIEGDQSGLAAELTGLRAQHYDDATWTFLDSSLRLVNSRTNEWSPIVAAGNSLVVRDSELADQAFSSGDGRVLIEDSTLSTVRARDEVEITVRDSDIRGDVVAQDDGTVILERTTVGGTIAERDQGRVFVRE